MHGSSKFALSNNTLETLRTRMKDKVQIGLLSVIAIALVALAYHQFSGGSASDASSVVASNSIAANLSLIHI